MNERLSRVCLLGHFLCALTLSSATALAGDTTVPVALPDLVADTYFGYHGGLYSDGSNAKPDRFRRDLERMAATVQPIQGGIGLLAIGMSNTGREFSEGAQFGDPRLAFEFKAEMDRSTNSAVRLVNGAVAGTDLWEWLDKDQNGADGPIWAHVDSQLAMEGVKHSQVQVIWLKHAYRSSRFPSFKDDPSGAHATSLSDDLETLITQELFVRFPNLKIVFLSCRSGSSLSSAPGEPDPHAFENAFGFKWLVERQISGDPNLYYGDPDHGFAGAVAPMITWSIYLWDDPAPGSQRSDGFVWTLADLAPDLTHPSCEGVEKIGDGLLSFFKTDPAATPWFLSGGSGNLHLTLQPDSALGTAPLAVAFSATGSGGAALHYDWNFDDGTWAIGPLPPVKTFRAPGAYEIRCTLSDAAGHALTRMVPITVLPDSKKTK